MEMHDTDVRFPQTALSLLNRFKKRELTFQEFMAECAYWALKDGFSSLKPFHYPAKPQKVIELQLIPKEKRSRLTSQYYHDNPEIMQYIDVVFVLRHKNKANFEWLQKIKQYIPEGDLESHNKIDARILEFQAAMDVQEQKQRPVRQVVDKQTAKEFEVFSPQGAFEDMGYNNI